MKKIFRGGYNSTKQDSINKSILFEYKDIFLKELDAGKNIMIVTAAHFSDTYTSMVAPFIQRGAIEVNQEFREIVDWKKYDWVIVMGGSNHYLVKKLKELNFSFEKMKQSAHYIGDSAGAMVQAAYYYVRDRKNNTISFHEGLVIEEKIIFIVHANNPWYVDSYLLDKVKKFAQDKKLEIICLEENEEIVRV